VVAVTVLVVFVLILGLPGTKAELLKTSMHIPWPGLHN